jgi:hypothetical protein
VQTKIEDGPVRTCVGCRAKRPKGALVRIALGPDGVVSIDREGSAAPGRGAYVCPEEACIERATRSGALRRSLRDKAALPGDLKQGLLRRIEAPAAETGGGKERGRDVKAEGA